MPDDETRESTESATPKRPRWKRKRWWIASILVLLVGALVWLNGPGWRFIGEKAGGNFLSKQGLEGDFELKGTLSGGEVGAENVDLKGDGMIESVEIDELNIRYNPREVVKSKIEGIDLKGADFKIDLSKAVEKPEDDEPFAPEDLPALLAKLHEQLGPIEINAEDVAATIRNGDELVFSIESSSIRHQPGSPVFELDLGAMELPGGRRLDPQRVTINWTEDSLTIERLDAMPEVVVRNLSARYPDEQTLRFSAEVLVSDTILAIETDLDEASVSMSGEPLTLAELGSILVMDLPVEAKIDRLDLRATGVGGGLETIEGTLQLEASSIAYEDLTISALSLDATGTNPGGGPDGGTLRLELEGIAYDDLTVSGANIDAGVTNAAGGLETIDGTLQLELSEIDYDDWSAPRLLLHAALQGDQLATALTGEALGSPLELDATTTLARDSNFLPTESDIELAIPGLEKPLTLVRDRFIGTTKEVPIDDSEPAVADIVEGIDPPRTIEPDSDEKPEGTAQVLENPDGIASEEPAAVEVEIDEADGGVATRTVPLPDIPVSSLSGTARLTFTDGKPDAARADLSITSPAEDVPPISLAGDWSDAGAVEATLGLPGLDLDAGYQIEARDYSGDLAADGFAPESLEPWLQPFGIEVPGGMLASLRWEGGGALEEATHHGEFDLKSFEWTRADETRPLKVFASGSYNWPEMVDLDEFNVQQDAQKIEGSLRLENRTLDLEKLSWSDGDDILLNGTGTIPVGENPADWKAILRSERPIQLSLQSTRLPLAKLHPFIPETVRFTDASVAELGIELTGSAVDPVLDAKLDVDSLGLVGRDNVPPTDIDLQAVGRDQTLKLEGSVNATGYPAAEISAVTNWNPEQWAEDPETLRQAKLDATVNVSDLNLELFSEYVPDARRMEGVIDIDAEITGTVGEPEPRGTLTLSGGRFETNNVELPRLKDGEVKIVATPERIEIEEFNATVSGGTLNISGGLDLEQGQPQNLAVRLSGRALPARRDDSMIIRLNADLSLTGAWETATLGGSIDIVDSLFFKDIEILPIGVPFNQPSEPKLPSVDAAKPRELTAGIPEPFRDWRLDLTLGTANPFLIRGNLANGEAVLDARVAGTIANPRPTGGATVRNVEAELPFSTLEIERGRIILRPNRPFDPLLELRGESTVRPYLIDIYVYGPISDPTVLPTANPPLPESEIMTLLATGTTTDGLEDPDAATARAAQLLIEEIRRGRIKNVRWMQPVLSVLEDVDFQIGAKDPYTSTKYNSATIDLNDRLLLRAGLSEDGHTRTSLTYLLRFR